MIRVNDKCIKNWHLRCITACSIFGLLHPLSFSQQSRKAHGTDSRIGLFPTTEQLPASDAKRPLNQTNLLVTTTTPMTQTEKLLTTSVFSEKIASSMLSKAIHLMGSFTPSLLSCLKYIFSYVFLERPKSATLITPLLSILEKEVE